MGSIAIIGSGISGMGAAFLLGRHHDITVYEKAETIGGHTRTKNINYNGTPLTVDTGFIVFNYRNYPHLSALFEHLGVPVQKSNMSFAVSKGQGELEWSAESPNAVFGQRSNLFNPLFYGFLLDVVKFNRKAISAVQKYPGMTMRGLIERLKLGKWFADYYILPMGGAIWSCTLESILDFPAENFVNFFEAHGLLTITQQPQWFTVTGGSQEYVKQLTKSYEDKIRTSCGAVVITRSSNKVTVEDAKGERREYDRIVLACHANEALALLKDATADEKKVLGAFQYQRNVAVLHKDVSLMPTRRRCWASWVYHAPENTRNAPLSVTYWMNQLQAIDKAYPVFVTLNPMKPIPAEHVFDTHVFEHPIYSMEAVAAQKLLPSIQGKKNTWFCGAYQSNGFHEDGLKSAVNVASQLGVKTPW